MHKLKRISFLKAFIINGTICVFTHSSKTKKKNGNLIKFNSSRYLIKFISLSDYYGTMIEIERFII